MPKASNEICNLSGYKAKIPLSKKSSRKINVIPPATSSTISTIFYTESFIFFLEKTQFLSVHDRGVEFAVLPIVQFQTFRNWLILVNTI